MATKKTAEYLNKFLNDKGYKSTTIHSNLSQIERETALNNFRKGIFCTFKNIKNEKELFLF